MNVTRPKTLLACALLAGLAIMPLTAQTQAPAPATPTQGVPKDLRPLLSPRQSEMRFVTLRYTLDRATLSGNFLGGARPGGGRSSAAATVTMEPVSPNRIARLKRFDMDWQAALARLDASTLSPAARADIEALNATVVSNLRQLDADTEALAQLSPLLPFAPATVQLVEARIRLEEVDAQKAAGAVTAITKAVDGIRARVEAGLAGSQPDALRVSKTLATRTAVAVDTLRGALTEYFTFYNGYDPLFTWWMGLPCKRADAALQAYAALLRGKVTAADLASSNGPAAAMATIPPAPVPKFASVPDLPQLLALPQDEMMGIVQQFRGVPAGGRGGRGGTEAASESGAAVRDRTFYEDWLRALKTLTFDALSRNAQVDYLFIRTTSERQIARLGVTLPANPPRKTDDSGIPGAARGRQGLIFDLQDEFVPYTPEELIALADKEFAWCEDEMKKASRQLGMGDDWKKAVESVKEIHPPPGGQVGAVRDLMFEAVDYLRAKDLLTVPAVAAESLHMIMMTPERQLVNPFFTGGSLISVSYPTDTMEYESRIQGMRGNNTPFSHATAFHEMIPGHNLVFYTNARFAGYRATLVPNTAFYGEGWPLYWELLMYDLGFQDTPERRIGALFWRMHRCARIIFSLRFHMGDWSPQECIDFLVSRLGHERENATAEVRRSFQGGYGPLYQAAYLLGGLQLRALRRELVDTNQMGNKAFHDEILRQGSIPIALLRLVLSKQKLTRDTSTDWKFY